MRFAAFYLLASIAIGVVSAQPCTVYGIVRNQNGEPIEKARVRLSNSQTGSEVIARTGQGGVYALQVTAPGEYTVEANYLGQISAKTVSLHAGATLPLDFEITVASPYSPPVPGSWGALVLPSMIAALVTLLILEPGRKVLVVSFKPIVWLKDKGYEFLAPRFPDWIGLPGYRKRVGRSDLAWIENPVGPQGLEVPIKQAFAPLMVISGDAQERTDLFSFTAEHKRLIVLGGPGTGKTTLMKSMVVSVVERCCHQHLNHLIPVFVVLREMAAAGQTVEQAIQSAFASFGLKNGARFVETALQAGRLLVVLDGLDEVGASRPLVTDQIHQFCRRDNQREAPNHLVITCRENSYRQRDLADVVDAVVRVEPFTPQHMRVFLQGWPSYRGRTALDLYREIQKDAQIRELCRNPLLLTILTGLYLSSDKFDLPSSRDRFFSAALDELLVQRPARRGIQQKFREEEKRDILQRVSLERLETANSPDDPELLSRERLMYFAKEVRGGELKAIDFRDLLDELVHINGIVRPASEESYVLGHRSFQEYLAAREANRVRRTSEVVAFNARPELSEVMCFYCGLIQKIPDVEAIIAGVIGAGDPVLAGRCLLNTVQVPTEALIRTSVEALFEPIRSGSRSGPELLILSSLAQRREAGFESARQRFSDAIDLVAGSAAQVGAIPLVAALATTPETAMRLVPGLLRHPIPAWRVAAVELLHDIGTEDALDYLVKLLEGGGPPERGVAAMLVANLIRTRNADLKNRAVLLKEQQNRRVWPFERYFPARIAVPVVEALASVPADSRLQNRCVGQAVSQFKKSVTTREQRLWARVERDLRFNRLWKRVVRGLRAGAVAMAAVWVVGVLAVLIWCTAARRAVFISVAPLNVTSRPAEALLLLRREAAQLFRDVQNRYPPTVSGLARVLPWNWRVERRVPTPARKLTSWLRRYPDWPYRVSISDFSEESLRRDVDSLGVSPGTAQRFLAATQDVRQLGLWQQVRVEPASDWWMVTVVVIDTLFPIPLVLYTLKRRMNIPHRPRSVEIIMKVIAGTMMVAPFLMLSLTLPWRLSMPPAIITAIALLTLILGRVELPPNRFMELIQELAPSGAAGKEGGN